MAGKNVLRVLLNRFVVLSALMLVVGAVLAGQSSQVAVKSTVEQFIQDFKDNKLRAETTYIGKIVELTGILNSIKKDSSGLRVTFVKTKIAGFAVTDIDCYFSENAFYQLLTLEIGQKVTIRGLCKNADTLQNCEIVK